MKDTAKILKRKGASIRIPAKYASAVAGAGWVGAKWWSNGFYNFSSRGTMYYRLCLTHSDRPQGYNAVVKKSGKGYVGLVWDDMVTQRVGDVTLAEAVNGK